MTLFLALITAYIFQTQAAELSPEQVVRSSLEHVPQVIEALEKLKAAENRVDHVRGAFDAKVKSYADIRADGYYSGDAYKISAEKPLPFFNGNIYGGVRQSYGDFPVYDQKMETLSKGETFIGASLSILRDSLIDDNRYKIRSAKQDRQLSKINLERAKIQLQTEAIKAYWTWVVKGHESQVYQNILRLSEDRANQLGKRIRAGDLAKIYRLENSQYVEKWRAEYLRSQMEFQQASYYLSLFHRDDNGQPIHSRESYLPKVDRKPLPKISDRELLFSTAKNRNLLLKDLDAQIQKAKLDIELGTNQILPRLDVNFEWSQDSGNGPTRLTKGDSRIYMKLEIPIEYRKGLGLKRSGQAKSSQLRAKGDWVLDNLRVQINTLATNLDSYSDIFRATQIQEQMASKLAKAERRKFSQGASDLILVNIREENLARAQVKKLSSLLSYHFTSANIKELQMNFIN